MKEHSCKKPLMGDFVILTFEGENPVAARSLAVA